MVCGVLQPCCCRKNIDMQTDLVQIEQEICIAVGELILGQMVGRREFARAIFNALVPQIQQMPHYNQRLKLLTELTLDAAGGENERLEFRPGERPRLKTLQVSSPSLTDSLDDLRDKFK